MPLKTCPKCGHHYTAKAFLKITSHRFECHNCQVELRADLRYFILAVFIVAPILALPISATINDWRFLPLIPVAMVAAFFIYYWLFGVTLFHKERGEG